MIPERNSENEQKTAPEKKLFCLHRNWSYFKFLRRFCLLKQLQKGFMVVLRPVILQLNELQRREKVDDCHVYLFSHATYFW